MRHQRTVMITQSKISRLLIDFHPLKKKKWIEKHLTKKETEKSAGRIQRSSVEIRQCSEDFTSCVRIKVNMIDVL